MLLYTLLDGICTLWVICGLYGEINGSYDAIDSLYGAIGVTYLMQLVVHYWCN